MSLRGAAAHIIHILLFLKHRLPNKLFDVCGMFFLSKILTWKHIVYFTNWLMFVEYFCAQTFNFEAHRLLHKLFDVRGIFFMRKLLTSSKLEQLNFSRANIPGLKKDWNISLCAMTVSTWMFQLQKCSNLWSAFKSELKLN